jgi:hypothetical protein
MKVRFAPPPVFALLAVTLLAGCGIDQIPLFNNSASLKNKIGSAYEIRTEINTTLADAVQMGLLTQDQVNTQFMPRLDFARHLIEQADELRVAGNLGGANDKLTSAKTILLALRKELAPYQRSTK